MSTGWFKRAVVLVAGVALSAGIAFAKDHDFDRGRHERWERARHERRWEARREHYRDHRRFERERWRERREHERMRWTEHRRDHRSPSGWEHGKKTGWNGASVPPGQEHKSDFGGRGHDDHHGR